MAAPEEGSVSQHFGCRLADAIRDWQQRAETCEQAADIVAPEDPDLAAILERFASGYAALHDAGVDYLVRLAEGEES